MNAPCKGCPDRYPACHDHCERYQAFHAERVRIREGRLGRSECVFSDRAKKAERAKLNRIKREH